MEDVDNPRVSSSFSFLLFIFLKVYLCLCVCMGHVHVGVYRGQECQIPLDLLQANHRPDTRAGNRTVVFFKNIEYS